MKLRSLFLVVMVSVGAWLAPLCATPLVMEAAEFYRTGEYNNALTAYLDLNEEYPNHPDILYNLGNTSYKLGKVGEALAYYYKAQRILPRDEDIRTNIALVSNQIIDDVVGNASVSSNSVFYFLMWFTLNEWLVGLVVLLTALTVLLWSKEIWPTKGAIGQGVGFVAVVFVIYLGFFAIRYHQESSFFRGVIVVPKVQVKVGPSESLDTKFIIHEGVDFEIKKQLDGWTEIKLSNGFSGWVEASDYRAI